MSPIWNNLALNQVVHEKSVLVVKQNFDSRQDNPFRLTPVHYCGKNDSVFKQIISQTTFWNKLSLRTEVPLYFPLYLKLSDLTNKNTECQGIFEFPLKPHF